MTNESPNDVRLKKISKLHGIILPPIRTPLPTLSFKKPWNGPIWAGLTLIITVINDLPPFNPFQHIIALNCIELSHFIALQIMPGPFLELYTGLKLVKRDYSLLHSMLQNATKAAKCVTFFITKSDSFITKCGSYYKLQQYKSKY